jgi:hypothetical protein
MHRRFKSVRAACLTAGLFAFAGLVAVPAASAHSGEFAKFNNCPSTNPAVTNCLTSVTTGGEVVLGSKRVPIVNVF